ncbi:P-loop containing nucleoside triphosphate hydrolases superfamily protein [Striga hermonthica]|uniref:P-loop containing nucleoside triphosphate hydrolases superfamily protein n=1 Tax=Striga hermonthica TaxID=68872 RepID=A0A9N7NNJ7_STRHE|nr:P-loop containing nucleoside triphosphate hydrolases superfamily protein [Striga hermonthica]
MEEFEGHSGGGKRKSWPKDRFIDLVFSWSIQEIFDENMYKNQVEKIPEEFDSVDRYLGSYVYPLLEETRAELSSAMETVYKAPFAEVMYFVEDKSDAFFYDVRVDHWRNSQSNRGKEAYRTLPGDIILVSNMKPETACDLERAGWAYTFACVTKIPEDEGNDGSTSCNFKVRMAEHVDTDGLYVVFLMNVSTQKRIWNALGMRRNLRIIEKVISRDDMVEKTCELCLFKYNINIEEKLEQTFTSKLNESQLEAISASLSKVHCNHTSSIELMWGPPGTGKTTTLSVLLYALLKMNVRTLVCAPTNIAITELASRVIALMRNSVESKSEKNFRFCSLGEILIFGNKDRLKIGSEIEEIFLEYRVKRILECLVSYTGWQKCVSSMLDFLEDCVSQHQIFLENELIKARESTEEEEEEEVQKPPSMSLLEFARDRFPHIAKSLRRCMQIFLTHLPRRSYHEQTFKNMEQVIFHLDAIENSLFADASMTSNELESVFLQKVVPFPESLVDTSSLVHARSQCLSILKSLNVSLGALGLRILTSKYSAEEFCFQRASLIFCTTSSSYKLHSFDMEPFNLLVIDEAAQVKESESIIALQVSDVGHAILVGDEWQLPATVKSKLSEDAGFGRSLFERLSSLGHSKHLLNVQYRMHPSISRFPNSNFYLNQILDAPYVKSPTYERRFLQGRMFGPYSFINVRGGKEELDDVGHSRRNMVEVAVIVKLVQKLYKAWDGSNESLSIGLISPYAAQVAAIRDRLHQKYENLNRFTVKVKSVDGFQGGEEDIIIISTVRSHSGGSIGFLSSSQRTNVALTRARHNLWILGNERTLSKSDSVWEALLCDAKSRKCFFNADEDDDIGKTIINVKKELQQLDDLLNGDSILFQNSRWKVLFSDNFRKSFQRLKPSNVKKLAINILLKLASGWRPKKVNVDWECKNSSYIVKQFKVEKYFVVCSIDISKDSIYFQVFKVWDILPIAETSKLLNRLDSIFAMYTDDFIKHCNEKLFEGNLEIPRSWSVSKDIIRYKNSNNANFNTTASASANDGRTFVENSKVNESLLLMKFYSLSSGIVNHLLTDAEGREVDLPFEVTDEEREIIMFSRSSFILGRSGTGKTTVLTMKLYQKLQQYVITSHESVGANEGADSESVESPTLHQLFVTVSPKLCFAVKKHVTQLKSFASGNLVGSITDMDEIDELAEFKDIPDTFVGIQPEKYPLIITFHKFLMMLDGTLGNSYFERFREVRGSSQYDGGRSIALQTFIRKNEVTYDRFRALYWPRLNEKLTKNLDPSRVFIEIMSHIKGGLQEGEACNGRISRTEYLSLSESRISTLTAEKREFVYDIFEDYEKMKLERGEFDLADFVIDIHLRLKNENLSGDKMDFVYIDEVQDLTMRQISLFQYICKNVDEGFVFSGDTAQTIARGIDFRFEDIRSLFYTEFFMKSRNGDFRGKREKGHISDIFCLSQNFRTHTGVLRLAHSVIDIICHFFPLSIDVLPPETSLIYGESPVVLEPGSDENLIMTIFGHSANAGRKWVGFGADQVILVRDESARNEIFNYIGHQALVLTIVECKGLEFQDVLLYNFFGSSPLSNQWRVLYEFLKEKDLLDANSPNSFPSFSHSKHSLLCSELKQLYVAITRTRQRLWICENNEELSKPMLDYWRRLCLVQVRKIDDSLAEAMQRASTPEEWKSQGIKLFWEKNYEMATLCFEKAADETWEKRAKASGLRASADTLRGLNPDEAHVMLREAAEIFDSIGRADSAAECFCELGEYERAGNIYLKKCGISELRKAGECFSLAGSYRTAAEVYAKGNFFDECLTACTKGNYFDLGLQYIEQWKQQMSLNSKLHTKSKEIEKISQEFLEKIAVECHKKKDNASLMKFVRAFNTMESKRLFLKSIDCLDELLTLEEESGNFHEAADIAKRLGDILREADLLEKAGDYSDATSLILSYVLSNSLWQPGSHGWPLKAFSSKEKLLTKAVSIARKVSGTFHASVSSSANAIMTHEQQKNLSELMQWYRSASQSFSRTGVILTVRKLLDSHLQVHPTKFEWDLKPENNTRLVERILRNQASCRTLVYVWNLWKSDVFRILDCLDSLKWQHLESSQDTAEFCFNYFGVRSAQNLSGSFVLLKPDAAWVANAVDKRFIVRENKLAFLDARHFVTASQNYWRGELISTGFKVLEVLQTLHKFSFSRPISKYCQCSTLICIYEVTRFFIESNSLDVKKGDERRLQEFLQLSAKYFEFVFPLDPRQSLSENLIWLRETEISKDLLGEIISMNISTRDGHTYAQFGRVVTIMLASGKPRPELLRRITERFGGNMSWKPFMESFEKAMNSYSSGSEIMIREFHRVLEESFHARWSQKDCISPNCFVYLVERLLILVPHPKGIFFTSKSSFVEHVMCLQPDADPCAGFFTDKKFYSSDIFKFLFWVVQQCLFKYREAEGWIKKSGINCRYYLPVLVLRLIIILCSLCLNSDCPFNVLYEMLNAQHIRSKLPVDFCRALCGRRKDVSYVDLVASAFKLIGDPLVIVSSGGARSRFACPDAVFLDMSSFSRRNEVLEVLFPKSTDYSDEQPSDEVAIIIPPPLVSGTTEPNEESDIKSSSENEIKGKVEINWGLIREMSEALESLEKTSGDRKLESLVLEKKVEIEEHMNLLISTMSESRSDSGEEGENELHLATDVFEELNTICSSLDTTSIGLDHKTISSVGQHLKSLEMRIPKSSSYSSVENDEPNVASVAPQQMDVEKEEEEEEEASGSSVYPTEDRKTTRDLLAGGKNLGSEGAGCSKGKGQSKKNKKSKKGKGGRRK